MKLAYFANETPFPPTHGGRVDTWARIQAMKAAGAEMALVSWYAQADEPLPHTTLDALSAETVSLHLFVIRPTWMERLRRLVRLVRWPSHVSSRVPVKHVMTAFWREMDAFKPDAVWLDALYGTVLARACAQRYGIPLFYRSHNIEHRYMAGQVARAESWRNRLAWAMNLPHLKRIEFSTVRAAHTCFDISMDDVQWWAQQGFKNMQWLPPVLARSKVDRLQAPLSTAFQYDVGYLGNLHTPNNVEGVLWFLTAVWPQIRTHHPAATMVLAGSSPSPAIHAAVAQAVGVTLVENAPDAIAVLRSARVLVNPVFGGSGVNIKSVEMLFAPGQRVSTTQGVAGLPMHVKQCFHVTNQAPAFAQAVLTALDSNPEDTDGSAQAALELARAEFDFSRVQHVLAHMQAVCE